MAHDSESIGDRIRQVREAARLSKNAFAKRIGVTQPHVSRVERGLTKPSSLMLDAVESKFNVNREWLETGKGLKNRSFRAFLDRQFPNKDDDDRLTAAVMAVLAEDHPKLIRYILGESNTIDGPPIDPRLMAITAFLWHFWMESDERERNWLEVQLSRMFPEFKEFTKRHGPGQVEEGEPLLGPPGGDVHSPEDNDSTGSAGNTKQKDPRKPQ